MFALFEPVARRARSVRAGYEEENKRATSSRIPPVWRCAAALAVLLMLSGCMKRQVGRLPVPEAPPVASLTTRVVDKNELKQWSRKDPDLTVHACMDILARLNGKALHYIEEDIKNKKKLEVPDDFTAYKDWTPLPVHIAAAGKMARFILIVKDIPFLGWYENGRMLNDSLICIGKKSDWTKAGLYTVKDRDENHFSQSYQDADGNPAPMPWALRIYEHVWIHAGDIPNKNCSHGCINVPVLAAMDLFRWAKTGTVVLIVDSLDDVEKALKEKSKSRS